MKFLAPFLGPICYAISLISLVLLFLFRNSEPTTIIVLAFCCIGTFILGYITRKQAKEEALYNFFPNRIHTETTVYSLHLRLDNTEIIGYNGVPELKSASELDIREENNKYNLYFNNQKLGYIPENTNAYKLTRNCINDPSCILKAIIRKDGDKTFDIACYSE
ncbi:MAG: hypothetical protein ACOX7J_05895 [Bacillota bacterium]|jgi:hypothetical protein